MVLFEIVIKPFFPWSHDFLLPDRYGSLVHPVESMGAVWEEYDGLVF
jgi:hypothetical protein